MPGAPYLAAIMHKASLELQQGQPGQHRSSLGVSGEGQGQHPVGFFPTAHLVQGISTQELGCLIRAVQLHQERSQLENTRSISGGGKKANKKTP